MWKFKLFNLIKIVLFILLMLKVNLNLACNEGICASIVSKCMLTESCKCNITTCDCCKECFTCLNYLYDECCSCFELCPKPIATENPLGKKSHVEDISEPIPELFQALTAEPDEHERWIAFKYPVDFDISLLTPKDNNEVQYILKTADKEKNMLYNPHIVTMNCTVAFMEQCVPWNKCKQVCQSMGATSYRWFHDGCCECIGNTCINYGINESRCLNCPLKVYNIQEYDDYGQEDDTYLY